MRRIKMAMDWRTAALVYTTTLANGTPEGKHVATRELLAMGEKLDEAYARLAMVQASIEEQNDETL